MTNYVIYERMFEGVGSVGFSPEGHDVAEEENTTVLHRFEISTPHTDPLSKYFDRESWPRAKGYFSAFMGWECPKPMDIETFESGGDFNLVQSEMEHGFEVCEERYGQSD